MIERRAREHAHGDPVAEVDSQGLGSPPPAREKTSRSATFLPSSSRRWTTVSNWGRSGWPDSPSTASGKPGPIHSLLQTHHLYVGAVEVELAAEGLGEEGAFKTREVG